MISLSVYPSVRPSVCLSHAPHSRTVNFRLWLLQNTNIMLQSTHWSAPEVNNATQPSPVLLQKHSPGGCTVDVPRRTIFDGAYRFRCSILYLNIRTFSTEYSNESQLYEWLQLLPLQLSFVYLLQSPTVCIRVPHHLDFFSVCLNRPVLAFPFGRRVVGATHSDRGYVQIFVTDFRSIYVSN